MGLRHFVSDVGLCLWSVYMVMEHAVSILGCLRYKPKHLKFPDVYLSQKRGYRSHESNMQPALVQCSTKTTRAPCAGFVNVLCVQIVVRRYSWTTCWFMCLWFMWHVYVFEKDDFFNQLLNATHLMVNYLFLEAPPPHCFFFFFLMCRSPKTMVISAFNIRCLYNKSEAETCVLKIL